jgi:hypothetical protein
LFPGIFPHQMAPIVRREADGGRDLVMARWGMPGPPQNGGQPVTNSRNVSSRIGDDGSGRQAAASLRQPRSANTRRHPAAYDAKMVHAKRQ